MRYVVLVLLLVLSSYAGPCNKSFAGLAVYADIVENKEATYIIKVITDKDRIVYSEVSKNFILFIKDSVYMCWTNYSQKQVMFQGDSKKYPVLERYMETNR